MTKTPSPPDFEAVYEKYASRVYTLAHYFCSDPVAAEDITQSVFLKIYRGLRAFRGEAELGTWIYRITHNACLDHARRQRIRALFWESKMQETTEAPPPDSSSPLDQLERHQTLQQLHQALANLPARYRMPLLLRYLEERSYQEIASILKCRVGTVASRINRGQRILAKKLRHLERMPGSGRTSP